MKEITFTEMRAMADKVQVAFRMPVVDERIALYNKAIKFFDKAVKQFVKSNNIDMLHYAGDIYSFSVTQLCIALREK